MAAASSTSTPVQDQTAQSQPATVSTRTAQQPSTDATQPSVDNGSTNPPSAPDMAFGFPRRAWDPQAQAVITQFAQGLEQRAANFRAELTNSTSNGTSNSTVGVLGIMPRVAAADGSQVAAGVVQWWDSIVAGMQQLLQALSQWTPGSGAGLLPGVVATDGSNAVADITKRVSEAVSRAQQAMSQLQDVASQAAGDTVAKASPALDASQFVSGFLNRNQNGA